MANTPSSKQDRLAVYAALAASLAVGALSYFDYRDTRQVYKDPYARADPWTGSDHEAYEKLVDTTFEHVFQEIHENRKRIDANDALWQEHLRWGRKLAGENEVELKFMQRDIQRLQDQMFDLYTGKSESED